MAKQEKTFRVPWALDATGCLIAASDSITGDAYWCPGCKVPLVLKAGKLKARHFAHKAEFGCSWESYLHNAAKVKIQAVVEDWLYREAPAPAIVGVCRGTDWWGCDGKIFRPLITGKIDEVRLEHQLEDIRPDALLLRNGIPVLGVEILVTHAVDDIKRAKFQHSWVELSAADVLNSPLRWSPVQHNIPSLGQCDLCAIVNLSALARKVEQHVANFDRWVKRARNPTAADNSLWCQDLIEKEILQVRRAAVIKWQKSHVGEPPKWNNHGFPLE